MPMRYECKRKGSGVQLDGFVILCVRSSMQKGSCIGEAGEMVNCYNGGVTEWGKYKASRDQAPKLVS